MVAEILYIWEEFVEVSKNLAKNLKIIL